MWLFPWLCSSLPHFLELVKKQEKYSFQLVTDYVTDTEKNRLKNDTISLQKMNEKNKVPTAIIFISVNNKQF